MPNQGENQKRAAALPINTVSTFGVQVTTVCAIRAKKEKPRKHRVFGAFLACLTRFERAAFRVGGVPKKVYEKP